MKFAYHRSLSPMIGVIVGLGVVETIVVHIVAMAFWGWKVAVVPGLIDISVVIV